MTVLGTTDHSDDTVVALEDASLLEGLANLRIGVRTHLVAVSYTHLTLPTIYSV